MKVAAKDRPQSSRESPLKDAFSLALLWDLLEQKDLKYELDLNVCRCEGGAKQKMHNRSAADRAVCATVKGLFEVEMCTVQFLQPQRYVDRLHEVLFLLESEFGALWGCNAYLTPKDAQGLAPHYDDVEVFVVQLEGRKHWKIYKRVEDSAELAMESSGPLPPSLVGEVEEEVLLEPGDMLYLPRGTVHSATSDKEQHSTHVTISTYQRQSGYDFISSTTQQLLDDLALKMLRLRQGLPLKYFEGKQTAELRRNVASLYRDLAEAIEEGVADAAFEHATKEYAIDFMLNRLPPPSLEPAGEPSSHVAVVDPSYILHFHDESNEEDDAEEGSILRVVSCVKNDRMRHMGPAQDESARCNISVDALPEVDEFFQQLINAYPKGLQIPEGETVKSFVQLLQEWGVIRFVQSE